MSFAYPVRSSDEIKQNMLALKKEHHQASHHFFAFSLGAGHEITRSGDDREPAGTAGKPILNQILSAGLTDILIVVARYFGGSLLGVPGLIHAYKTSARDAIDHAEIITKFVYEQYRISFSFSFLNEIMAVLRSLSAVIIAEHYTDECTIDFKVRKSMAADLISTIRNLHHDEKLISITTIPVSPDT